MMNGRENGEAEGGLWVGWCGLVSLMLVWFLVSCQGGGSVAGPVVEGSLVVDDVLYKRKDPRPYVATRSVDNRGRLWLVDSGATRSVIFIGGSRDYTEVPVERRGEGVSIHGMFGSDRVRSRAFKYEPVNRPVIRGLIMEPDGVASGVREGSIMGLDYLRQNRVVFDVSGRRLLWSDAGGEGTGVRLFVHPVSRHLMIRVEVRGERVQLILDTGAAKSLLSMEAARRLGLKYQASQVMLSGVSRANSRVYLAKKVPLQLASEAVQRNWDFYIHPVPGLLRQLNEGSSVRVDGVLGYDFIRNHLGSIDFGRSSMVLK